MTIAAILLAADRSSRFEDGNKLLADLDGRRVITRATQALDIADVSDVVAVTRHGAAGADVRAAITAANADVFCRHVTVPEEDDNASAMSVSLRHGLASLRAETTGAMIALGDMPLMTRDLNSRLCQLFKQNNGQRIVLPRDRAGRQGHPVIWPRALFAELASVTGDRGGKALFDTHAALVLPLVIDAPDDVKACFTDIDRADDLRAAGT